MVSTWMPINKHHQDLTCISHLKALLELNTLEPHIVITLACIAKYISIMPMLTLKGLLRGARAFTKRISEVYV